jgi:GT2 family glycosyltransferase
MTWRCYQLIKQSSRPSSESMYMQVVTPSSLPRSKMLCIVLSFNGVDDTAHCLDSIARQPHRFDVLVIDNGSQPGVVEQLRTQFPATEIVALAENFGWAGGNNAGIKLGLERGYEWICLLNNDLVFPEGAVDAWFGGAEHLSPCLLHPSIYYWDEPEVAQLHPGHDGIPVKVAPDLGGNLVLPYAYGACLGIHRSIFEKVGVFDERFFLQLEETDFYLRAQAMGYTAVCNASVKIFHKESRAFGGTAAPIKTYYATRNHMLLTSKAQRGLKNKIREWKYLYWTLRELAAVKQQRKALRIDQFLVWLFSATPSAMAVRFAFRDYFTARFGRISAAHHAALKSKEVGSA